MTQELKKERNTLEDAAAKLLSFATDAGADAAEVCATYGSSARIALEKGDYHMASADDGYTLGVRVLRGQQQGFASGNTIDPKELKEIALKAVEIAGFSPENPHQGIGPTENIPSPSPELWDDALHHLSIQTQKDWTRLLVEEATADTRFRLNEGSVSLSSSLSLVTSSQGTHKLERETAATWGLMGMAVDGDRITSFDYFQNLSRNAAAVPERLRATTRAFIQRVVADLETASARSYRGLVVLTPRAVADLLLDPLEYHVNGRNVVEKTSRWGVADIGQKILDPQITVSDRPWLSDRFGCSVFDREGTPTAPLTLVERGVLKTFLLDGYAARALDRPPTGHAAGGPTMIPSVGSHVLCVEPGKETRTELLERTRQRYPEFLVVHRYSGQVDPVTGDFSGVAKGGEWWQGGVRVGCVSETMISGNLFDAFGKSLFGLSKETEIVDSSTESPTIVVGNVSVTTG